MQQGKQGRMRVLMLCDFRPDSAGAIIDHIQAFVRYSAHEFVIVNKLGDGLDGVDLHDVDGIVVHYSLIACYDNFLAPATRRRIRAFGGFKAAFVQDDYRFIDRTVEALAYLGIHALFPLAGPDIIDDVYSPVKLPGVRKVTVLAGYVPEHLVGTPTPPYRERPIDVGYRARKLPAWLGSHTLQKWQISDRFGADAKEHGLVVDLSWREEDRIYGDDWIRFVTACKAMLGTESGASVCDFTGAIQANVEAHVVRDPDATFEQLRDLYFRGEDCRLMMNIISPRCFEAATLKTLMVMYEGAYSGVLEPWRHYVPLKMDHSNMAEVVAVIRDAERAERIIDCAYREIVLSGRYSYRALAELVDRVMAETVRPRMLAANRPGADTAARQRVDAVRRASAARLAAVPAHGERHRLEVLRDHFLTHPEARLQICYCPARHLLEFVCVPYGSPAPSGARRTLDTTRLIALLEARGVLLAWFLGRDPLGHGRDEPFGPFFQFEQFAYGLTWDTAPLRDLLLEPALGDGSWFEAFVVDAPVWDGSHIPPPVRPIDIRHVSSPLRFVDGFGIDVAIDGDENTYVAACDNEPMPQELHAGFGRLWRVKAVDLMWESELNLAADYSLRFYAGKRLVHEQVVTGNAAMRNRIEFPGEGIRAGAVRVTVTRFRGQPRLLLRQLAAQGLPAFEPCARVDALPKFRMVRPEHTLRGRWLAAKLRVKNALIRCWARVPHPLRNGVRPVLKRLLRRA